MDALTQFKPYKSGFLPVTDNHEIYYEVCGNPHGIPVLFVHGGPGGGFGDSDKRFFDLEKINLILFDQRGAGRSKPFASLHENTTQKLIEDMSTLLEYLKIDKTFLFGGSWGSTLSLAFAINYPEKVTGMLLRGIFLGTEEETNYWIGGGVKLFFPDVWEKFVSVVPEDKRNNVLAYYDKYMKEGDQKLREKLVYEWARYELSLSHMQTSEETLKKDLERLSFESLSPIEIHYMLHNCFLPKNYIVENLHKLSSLPISIVQGRYDVVCPPISAFTLHKVLPKSCLYFVLGGHSSSEPEIEKKLTEEMERMLSLI